MSTIEIKMGAIYEASRDVLPRQAGEFSAYADNITESIEPIVKQISLAGNHPIGDDLADVAVELFRHMRSMVKTFNDTAVALDRIAHDFETVNEEARAWFATHKKSLNDLYTAPIPPAPKV